MTKTTKIVLGVVLAGLVILAVLLGVGAWMASSWINEQAEEAIAQGANLKKEVDDFSATLPEAERQKFQACWQETSTPEFQEKAQAAGQENAQEKCSAEEAEKVLNCVMDESVRTAFEVLREHFESCKRQL